jgi:Holliday junction DNA helicase RuvA
MIGRIRGTLVERSGTGVVIDVGGVGYEVAMPGSDLAALPALGEEVVVHTHLHVREDQLALFGFAAAEGRDLFRQLIEASGVGPKLALAMLTALSPAQLHAAVAAEDVDALVAVPGIGKRSAQKLILDLRPRLGIASGGIPGEEGGAVADVREALEALGYSTQEIRQALDGLDADTGVEDLLRTALQRLGRP